MLETNTIKATFPSYLHFLFTIRITQLSLQQIVLLLLAMFLICLVTYIIYKYFQWKRQLLQKYVILEIKPPSISLQSAFSTKQLFTISHSIDHETSFIDRLLGVKRPVSYEIVSTKEEGIRYIFDVPEEDVAIIKKNLISYLSGVIITEVADYLPRTVADLQAKEFSIYEFKLGKSYVLPLQEQDILNKHDPIAYITGQMTKQEPNELIAIHMVTAPVTGRFHSGITEHILRLNKRMYEGKEIVSYLKTNSGAGIFNVINILVTFLFSVISEIVNTFAHWLMDFVMSSRNSYRYIRLQDTRHMETIKELSPKQKYVQDLVEKKINQNLFETSIRLFIIGSNKETITLRRKGIVSSFSTFNHPGYQTL